MGLFDLFKSNKEFISEAKFETIFAKQKAVTPAVVTQLRNINITEEKNLKLEFFFYTNTTDKANALEEDLKKLGYEVHYGIAAGNKKLFVITGWTTKMNMANDVIVSWAENMCELGYTHDCEFDGWGTTENQ